MNRMELMKIMDVIKMEKMKAHIGISIGVDKGKGRNIMGMVVLIV